MGKVIEFKKFSKRINKDKLNITDYDLGIFPEDELVYTRKEVQIRLSEMDAVISCVHKQTIINEGLIKEAELENDFEKLTYLKDFNDKLHDVIYFLTNGAYGDPIIISLNFLEFKYLVGTLQLEVELLKVSKNRINDDSYLEYLITLEGMFNKFFVIYKEWEKEFLR